MYLRMILALGVIGCANRPSRDEPPSRPAVEIKLLPQHAGATALWGNRTLLLGMTRDWDKPGLITMTRGDGDELRTIMGWVAGVVGDQAYVLVPNGTDLEIVRVGATGDPVVLATVPREEPDRPPLATVTGTGTVVVIARSLDPRLSGDGSVVDRHGADAVIIDATGARRHALTDPNERAIYLVGNPNGPELAVVGMNLAGEPSAHGDSWIELIDTKTTARRWEHALVPRLSAADGEVGFAGDHLVLHHGDSVVTFDLATGARATQWTGVYIDARNLVFSADGKRVAYTDEIGTGHMALSDPACNVMVIDAADPVASNREPVQRNKGACYFGMGLVWVDGALWIAPPGP